MYACACVCILTHIQIHTHVYVNGYAQMKPCSTGRNFLLLACKSIEEVAYLESLPYLLSRGHVDSSCEVEKIVLQCCFWAVSFPHILGAGGVKNRVAKTL